MSKQGEVADAHLFLRADVDVNQTIISFSGTLTCLSSRRLNVAAYMENERNFRFITENVSDMVAVLAEDGLAARYGERSLLCYSLVEMLSKLLR